MLLTPTVTEPAAIAAKSATKTTMAAAVTPAAVASASSAATRSATALTAAILP